MNNIISVIWKWLCISRIYALPMTVCAWLIVFSYGLKQGGSLTYGVIALMGLCFAHLGANLFDEFADYMIEAKKNNNFAGLNLKKGKCRFLINKEITPKQTFMVVLFYFFAAAITGLILFYFTGYPVLIVALLGGIIAILYPRLPYLGLGEAGIGLNFGFLLFIGVYYVMTQSFSLNVILIAISSTLITLVLLHTDYMMDLSADNINQKKTLCTMLKDRQKGFYLLIIMVFAAYVNIGLLIIFKILPPLSLITFLSLPTVFELIKNLQTYLQDNNSLVKKTFYMGPMEDEQILDVQRKAIMQRMFIARNTAFFFSLFLSLSILFS
ncbi:MAG: prenyltransferase [Candidatus Gastranaerophilales bacterium]|nr:prenyltransferase [Candidatus Gastranaerophilales bacterium]